MGYEKHFFFRFRIPQNIFFKSPDCKICFFRTESLKEIEMLARMHTHNFLIVAAFFYPLKSDASTSVTVAALKKC